jgi:hypothetical protein
MIGLTPTNGNKKIVAKSVDFGTVEFANGLKLENVSLFPPITYDNIKSVTDLSYLFAYNPNIENVVFISKGKNKISKMDYFLHNTPNLKKVIFPNMDNVTSCSRLISCDSNLPNKLEEVIIPNLPKATSAFSLLYQCRKLKKATIGDMPLTQYVNYLCVNCSNMTDLTIGDMGSAMGVISMLSGCSVLANLSIKKLPLVDLANAGFNASAVLTAQSYANIFAALQVTDANLNIKLNAAFNSLKSSDTKYTATDVELGEQTLTLTEWADRAIQKGWIIQTT